MANHRHDAGREKRPAGVIPRKRFGQHFLADRACIDAIVQAIAPRSGDNLVEIGPGTGVLIAASGVFVLLLAGLPDSVPASLPV